MADQVTTGPDGRPYRNGVLQVQSSPGSPGAAGAIRDAVAALASAFAPRALTDRTKRVSQAVDQATGDKLADQFN